MHKESVPNYTRLSGSAIPEWLRVAAISSVLLILLQLPYLLGYSTAPANSFYTGLLVNVEDANYITIIQRGSEGAWTHSLRFTSEPDESLFLYVFYLAWGHVAHIFNIEATLMWHIARIMMTFVTFIVLWGFVGFFFNKWSWRLVAYLLGILGAGFDWVALPWEVLDPTSATPVDLKMADAHLFSAALTFPHYLASIALLILLFWCAVRLLAQDTADALLSPKKFMLLLAGGALASLGIALVYPFFVILSCGVLGIYLVLLLLRARKLLWRQIFIVAALIVPTLPLALYYAVALSSSELLRVWSVQSQTLSPNPIHYLATFAPYLLLAALDLWRVGLGNPVQARRRMLLWAWVIVVALLVYAPLGAQRRFLQGVQVPLALLATFGWFEVVLPRVTHTRWFQSLTQRPNYSAQGLIRLSSVLLILLISMSSIYQWLSAVALATLVQPYPLFRPRAEVAAMDWLRTTAQAQDVVLSSYFTGSYLPYRSGVRAYVGHYYETIYFQAKEKNTEQFFDVTTADAARVRLLAENHIRFVFYGAQEKRLGQFDPAKALYLTRIFQNPEAAIYSVQIPE